jgi:hypothetical protein
VTGVALRSPGWTEAVGRWSGIGTVLAGAGLVTAGLWARREVRTNLARERIVSPSDTEAASAPVTCGTSARALAEVIRRSTLEATGGRTYSETELYLDAAGEPTSDRDRAQLDERTGLPVENPQHTLWLRSTTLQTALMQAYMAARIADLTIGLGVALLAAGAGVTASAGLRR